MKLKSNCTITETPDGGVILDMDSGIYWQVNRTGLSLLNALIAGKSKEELLADARRRYPALADVAATDVSELIAEFQRAKLILDE